MTGNKTILSVTIVATIVATLCTVVVAFPTGAPEQACKTLQPGHPAEPQTGEAPYKLSQDRQEVEASDQVKVMLTSPSKALFKGLLVQAIDEATQKPIGKFLSGKGLKTLDSCSAVTHADQKAKKTATLVWEAPADHKGKLTVSFKATVVQKFEHFYMGIKSTLS